MKSHATIVSDSFVRVPLSPRRNQHISLLSHATAIVQMQNIQLYPARASSAMLSMLAMQAPPVVFKACNSTYDVIAKVCSNRLELKHVFAEALISIKKSLLWIFSNSARTHRLSSTPHLCFSSVRRLQCSGTHFVQYVTAALFRVVADICFVGIQVTKTARRSEGTRGYL